MKARILIVALLGTTALALWMVAGCGGSGPRDAAEPLPVRAAAEPAADDAETRYIIGFRQAPTEASVASVEARGGRVRHRFKSSPAMSAVMSAEAAAALRRDAGVEYVRPAIRYSIGQQSVPWGITRVGAPVVHAAGNKGAGIKVAIIDTGIDYTHPDLAANYKGGYDFVNNDADPMDDHSHGTHCAGTVAAVDNSIGVIGVAPQASLYGVKVLNRYGQGWEDEIVAGIEWAADNGMHVASMSFGSLSYSGPIEGACNYAYGKGVLLVASAGNWGAGPDTVGYPARHASVIAVVATDSSDNRASFSSSGPAAELAAPGVAVLSTTPGGGYASWNGTSMACPHVAGAAALVMASGVTGASAGIMSPGTVRTRLQETAEDLGPAGRDNWFGFGLVRADLAAAGGAPITGTISGVVTSTSGGQPIAGATVQTDTGQSTQTGANGAYALSSVPTGSRQVTASADGYLPQTATVQVTDGQVTTRDFALTPAPVQPGAITGQVYQLAGGRGAARVIPGATVQTDTGQATQTDAQGSYTLNGVPPGARQVTASANGYQPETATVQVTSGQTARRDFFLRTGTSQPTTGTITGTVRNAQTSLPVAGATVQTDTGQSAQTGANGAYTLSNVPEGSRQVTATAGGYQSQTVTVPVVAGQTATRDFSLQPAPVSTGTITGTVRDAQSLSPIVGATVQTDTGQSTQTGSNGTYTLANVPQGSRRVTASATRYTAQAATVQVVAGQVAVQDFSLSRAAGRR